MVRNNRNSRGRARRTNRSRRRSNRTMRTLRLFRHPPNVSSTARNTGLSASGLSTVIAFEIPISIKPSAVKDGWATIATFAKIIDVTPDFIFKQRSDSINALRCLYSEYRLNRLTAHWVPHCGYTSSGSVAFAVVDNNFGTNAETKFEQIRVAPNSASVHLTAKVGRCWVQTEPTDADFSTPASVMCKILFGSNQLFLSGPYDPAKESDLGVLHCRADITCRSPLSKKACASLFLENCMGTLDEMSME